MDDFISVLNGFLHIKNLDIYITTSCSKYLSSDISTEFRGRGDVIKVYPLSLLDTYSFYQGNWDAAFRDYTTYGGIAQVLISDIKDDKLSVLQSLIRTEFINNLVQKHKIKKSLY